MLYLTETNISVELMYHVIEGLVIIFSQSIFYVVSLCVWACMCVWCVGTCDACAQVLREFWWFKFRSLWLFSNIVLFTLNQSHRFLLPFLLVYIETDRSEDNIHELFRLFYCSHPRYQTLVTRFDSNTFIHII